MPARFGEALHAGLIASASHSLTPRPSTTRLRHRHRRAAPARRRARSAADAGCADPARRSRSSRRAGCRCRSVRGPQRSARSRPSSLLDCRGQRCRRRRGGSSCRSVTAAFRNGGWSVLPQGGVVERGDRFDLDVRVLLRGVRSPRACRLACRRYCRRAQERRGSSGTPLTEPPPGSPRPSASLRRARRRRGRARSPRRESAAATLVTSVPISRLGLRARHLADEGFPRRPDEDREAERVELRKRARSSRFCSGDLPKPKPGSSTMRSSWMPARRAISSERSKKCQACLDRVARQRLARAEQAGIVHGDHAGAVLRRDLRESGSPCSPRMSLTIARRRRWRPRRPTPSSYRSRSARVTRAPSMTGRTRRISSLSRNGVALPRVDSPPMSRIAAPCCRASLLPCAIAVSAS